MQRRFSLYVDRSKAAGRMITINPDDPHWEENLEQRIQQATSKDEETNKKRVVYTPQPDNPSMPASVIKVELSEDEDVEWQWTHLPRWAKCYYRIQHN